ncbi:SusC/RagA family TonB-linked outer membrane protein [Christiangramia sabulilitoris]|uniref:TonB-dependent receptor n=1 Tax=Christiangramia sabulilitoris TaxID=2583991 RepID=A0A550I7T6_9FLAO|nr:TonB-dependent receptor [Christiangramia sabulilitoris]TRO67042.1 TonB-dependent receptor [Christiangramia sabulilitoris]
MKKRLQGLLTLLLVLVVQIGFAQEKTVTGTVVDEDGLPMPGVNVIEKNTNNGTQTDFDGNYSISIAEGEVLVFSYVGFRLQEITVGASSRIDVNLEVDAGALEEVVVVAYGTANRETITSSVSTVSAEEIESRPTASFAQALQSRAPGLNISTGNGQPGGNSTILLRGINSINGNVEPLFVIDGVPVDEDNFRSINQNDIESVSILKDASATAIYGNRATGGVILVTTKRGKVNEKLQIRYSGRTGFTFKPDPNFELTSSQQLLRLEREAGSGPGAGGGNAYVRGFLGNADGGALTDEQISQVTTNTDWTDVLLKVGNTTSHDLSFSAGSEKVSAFTSLGYLEQEGLALRSKLQRMNVRNNLTYRTDKFNLATNVSVGFSRSDIAGGIGTGTGGSGALDNPFIVPFVGKPYLSPYNEDGSLNRIGNPAFSDADGFLNTPYIALNVAEFDTNKETEIRAIGGLNANYDFTSKISAGINFGVDFQEETVKFLQPNSSIRGSHANDPNAEFQGFQFEALNRDTRMNSSVQLSYDDTFAEVHNVSVLGVSEFIYAEASGFSYNQTGLVPGLEGVGAGFVAGTTTEDPNEDGVDDYFYIPSLGSYKQNVGQFSYFGKATYDYDRIAGFDVTVRRDASSRFNEDNRWGTFWAVGAFYNLTKSILDGSNFVNDLKLRGSYGTTGNDRVASGYYSGLVIPFDLFNTGGGYNGSVGLAPSLIGNPNLKWEETSKANIGIDFALFNNNLTGSLDVYRNETTDLFIGRPNTSLSGGFTSISDNLGTLENKGIEAQFTYNLVDSGDFYWSVGANGSYNQNEITDLPGTEANQYGEVILDGSQRAVEAVGEAFNTYYAVRWAGVNPANGRPLYLDRDGNITEEYSLDNRVFTGKSSIPTYQGGFNTSMNYKGFSLDALFSFAADVYRYNGTLGVAEDPGLIGIANVTQNLLDAWREPGDITAIPSLSSGSTRNLLTDRYLEDASYLRLKNISLGYQLGDKIMDRTPLESVRIYVQGENLFTWTEWRGFDPEFDPFATNDFFTYPNSRIVTFGVDVKL